MADHGLSLQAPAPSRARAEQAHWGPWLRRVLGAVVLGAALGAAYVRRHELAQAWHLLGTLRWWWVGAAIGFEVASLIAFARLQWWLLRAGGIRLRVATIIEITLAGNAMAMSLPGGAAWAAAWAFSQLRRRGADSVLAGWVVLMAGAVASFVLFLLLVAGSFIAGDSGPVKEFRFVGLGLALIPAVAAIVAVAAHRNPAVRRALARAWAWFSASRAGRVAPPVERFAERVRCVQPTRGQWLEAFGLAALNWLETCGVLAACIIALGAHVPWRGILVAYTLAQVAASLPITPGGLGVVEGSLTALLIAYGMPTKFALAAVLLFRVVSFWGLVPIGWGAWALITFAGRRNPRRRAHPWATHRNGRRRDSRRAADRLLTPPPCRDCE